MEQAVGQRTDATSAAAERAHREADADRGDHSRPLGRYVTVLTVCGMLVAFTTVVAAPT
jgi:hypothetical protein